MGTFSQKSRTLIQKTLIISFFKNNLLLHNSSFYALNGLIPFKVKSSKIIVTFVYFPENLGQGFFFEHLMPFENGRTCLFRLGRQG